jgi:hypothetical protein
MSVLLTCQQAGAFWVDLKQPKPGIRRRLIQHVRIEGSPARFVGMAVNHGKA